MFYDPEIITNYVTLLDKVVNLFTSKELKQLHYAEALKMNRVTFKKRLDDKSFTPDELLKLVEEINKVFS
jgi:hypothetical protein